MKINYEYIKKIEIDNDAIWLGRLVKENQYLCVKAKRKIAGQFFQAEIPLNNGKTKLVSFVKNSDLKLLEKDERFAETPPRIRRKILGRPFGFCKGCEHVQDCSLNIPCKKRDQRNNIKEIGKDERFWNNGTPKKHLILCKYAKYMYAHKKTAGQCQKEKCSFYDNGKCYLNLTPKMELL